MLAVLDSMNIRTLPAFRCGGSTQRGVCLNRITVYNPRSAEQAAAIDAAPRPRTLRNALIGFIDNSKVNADRFIERLQPLLRERYGISVGPQLRKHAPKDALSERELEELSGCTAV